MASLTNKLGIVTAGGTGIGTRPRWRWLAPAPRSSSATAGPSSAKKSGEGSLSENVRDEINDLRKQVAELAMERDVLTRAAAFWAKEAMGS
jgi:hypothetical protein